MSDLEKQIAAAKSKLEPIAEEPSIQNQAWQFISELMAGLLVGGGIGWLLDRWFGTKPWLFAVFLLLGVAAAFWNIIKLASKDEIGHTKRD